MSKCSILQAISSASQAVDAFLSNPAGLTATTANNLISQILLVQGAAQALPINAVRKGDIIGRLNQAISLLQFSTPGLTNIEIILAVSQILQTVSLKVENLTLPCPQGIVTVHPSNTFSTLCNFCF
ncbi:MAG: hypothetical protein ACM3X9_02965 [Bacillota bacterium]